ncbi:YicC family protein [Pelotomaculum terephthalicicum JT]|uniref:YicC/YloC family endoribonuclease n=1 Tax=Pelotomaculum TaxID=191373 RepID=UPI0009CA5F4E|nr:MULTISPECIES: YicC/YloC family endoribonuclease [Pelotomaculum]MCG9967624.1 YicC family protein [Pelotomaculum terephthalicicum JT]OPX84079.1 MAG: hypothetical protein A4E54_03045 [Pelotomaculum sp. PtaB.Bin117]OPY60164.1 MAG: hypothetical protein A4E56_02864 [Pelotomaculum sp. PtaU1.Bin065]
MLKSMTGYGRGEVNAFGKRFSVELKAVNHRFCEVVLRMPRSLMSMEEQIKRFIQSQVARGRIDCFLGIEKSAEGTTALVKVDKDLAAAYYKAMKELQEELGVEGEIKLKHLTVLPGVMVLEEAPENIEEWWPAIREAVEIALEDLIKMRVTEGEQLAKDIGKRVGQIAGYNVRIRERAPYVAEDYRTRLETRLNDFLNDGGLDPERLAAEAALFAERSNITEETVRLDSHLSQVYACFDTNEAVGRKLDFLIQEMNREINTIASKANDLEINRLVIEVKSELEKIREQVQNIE